MNNGTIATFCTNFSQFIEMSWISVMHFLLLMSYLNHNNWNALAAVDVDMCNCEKNIFNETWHLINTNAEMNYELKNPLRRFFGFSCSMHCCSFVSHIMCIFFKRWNSLCAISTNVKSGLFRHLRNPFYFRSHWNSLKIASCDVLKNHIVFESIQMENCYLIFFNFGTHLFLVFH